MGSYMNGGAYRIQAQFTMRFFSKRTLWFFNTKSDKLQRDEVKTELPGIETTNESCRYRSTVEEKPMKNGCDATQLDMLENKYTKPKPPHWITRRVYFLTWLPKYERDMAVADLIAGITLGLTIIPQSLAYAALAGLTAEYGLYSAFVGSIIYVFFGTIPQVSIGPTSLMALLVFQYCGDKPVQFVIVLTFLAGLVELLMGVFKLGLICSFIPNPVTKAFTSGTASLIALVQFRSLLGIKKKSLTIAFWRAISLWDAVLGLLCIAVLLSLRQLSNVNFKRKSETTQRLKKLLWYISISRNAIVVFICATITFVWVRKSSLEAVPYAMTSKVRSGMPTFSLPPFAFEYGNVTYVFADICRELGSSIIVVPLVAALSNVAIAKAFVKDGSLDASQEMLTLGICNLAGSFFSAMPTCGAFTRSAVSQASGVRTPMAGIYTGIVVLSALSILTPYFQFIPKSTLAAVLISAVIFMIEVRPVKKYWETNKKDFFSWCGCFIVCILAGVEMGLLLGVVINMLFILLRLGNPKINVDLKELSGEHYIHLVPNSDIYYTGVDTLRAEIRSVCAMYRNDFPIVLDCSRFMQFDATFVDMLNGMAKELKDKDVLFVLQRMSPRLKKLMAESTNLRYCDDMLLRLEDFVAKQ